ncbi:hypothetical protein BGX38DRAFT_1171841 [Terfezia claveryi]|nr:hypothetical protein BGX38DRAFT_1171841 [Terfezia claveryi]
MAQRVRELELKLAASVLRQKGLKKEQKAQASIIKELGGQQEYKEEMIKNVANVQETHGAHIKKIRKQQGLQGQHDGTCQRAKKAGVNNYDPAPPAGDNGECDGGANRRYRALQSSIIDQQYYDLLRSRNYNDSVSLRPETTPGILLALEQLSNHI